MKLINSSVFSRRWYIDSLRIHLWMTVLCCLTGCGGRWPVHSHGKIYTVQKTPPGIRSVNWPLRHDQLRPLTRFTVQGYLEVCANQHKGINLQFRWEQSFSRYQLQLIDAEGHVCLKIVANKEQASLYIENMVYSGKNAESLLKKHLGMEIPLRYFPDWLKGVPQANLRHERVLNPTKHVLTLRQAGWFIRYLRYHQIRSIDLPTQLCMMQENCYVRILITHWVL